MTSKKNDDTKTMLRAIINGQSSMRSDLTAKINKLEQKVDDGFKKVGKEIRENRERIDKFGYELAELSSDAPTNEEFDELVEKVEKIYKNTHFA
jgi:DNA repair ATPase RecN